MKIFNAIRLLNKKQDENLVLLYEQKLEERKLELSKLDELLRTKRNEVVRGVEEKRKLDEELEKLKLAKNRVNDEFENISNRLELMVKLQKQETEFVMPIYTQISLPNNETNPEYLIRNDIETKRNEYNLLTLQTAKLQKRLKALKDEEAYLVEIKKEISISIEKFNRLEEEISSAEKRLKKLQEREKTTESKSFKQFYSNLGLNKANNPFKISLNKKTKDTQRCAAITKKGERCCKQSQPKGKLCLIHSKIVK
jgi:hypothetical protein